MEDGLIRRTKTSCLFILGLLFSVGSRLELENVMQHTFPCRWLNFGGMQLRRFLVWKKVSGVLRRYDMNGRFQMQGGKNWILPKEMNANRFFRDSHWLEIWPNHFCPSMGPNGKSVAMDSGHINGTGVICGIIYENMRLASIIL
jgi:hypothetical protein